MTGKGSSASSIDNEKRDAVQDVPPLEGSAWSSSSDEEKAVVVLEEPAVEEISSWTLRKRDLTVLPLLFLGLLVFQLDRMNVASALTGGFASDIHVTQTDINAGNLLMFAGIVLLEIPSNLVLQRLGPGLWLSAQVVLFGSVATLQVLVKDRAGFLVIRAVLGLTEAGYIPGACYTLSRWYRARELGRRTAVFFFGMFAGNALSPLLASGILRLDGRGLRGWQYIFLIEGLITVLVGLSFLLLLPESPSRPRPLLSPGLIRFSAEEANALQAVLPERQGGLPLAAVWRTVKEWRRWPHFIATFAVFSTWAPLTTYTPSIIKSAGFPTLTANALAAVGGGLSLVFVFVFAFISDKTNRRGAAVVLAQVCYLIALIACRETAGRGGRWSTWGRWTAVNAFAVGYHPVHNAWVQLNCEPEERSIAVAMWVMSAISGLMCGTQYFHARDAPAYSTGLRTMIIMVSVGIAMTLLQIALYRGLNRRGGERKWVP